MAFLLLGLRETLHYWGSVYFLGHVWVGVFMLVGYLCRPPRTPRKEKKDSVPIEPNQNVIKKGEKVE